MCSAGWIPSRCRIWNPRRGIVRCGGRSCGKNVKPGARPALDTLERPAWSPLRTAGMIALRGYLAVAVVLVGVKVAQTVVG